uniref:Uncharacterized protein n=1 Tax=Tanacetum cinerariifolium TaxID=118510 RepID=A0A6L2MTQ3_TANCI|nr:hypothetical protein [Tanacetum cinerariifolium]
MQEVILVHEEDPIRVQSRTLSGNIINAENENVGHVEICIRFNLIEKSGFQDVDQTLLHDTATARRVNYASPTRLPPPQTPWQMDVRPSAPPFPQQEAYGYPVTTRPHCQEAPNHPSITMAGSSTSSDDHPKDYPCTIMYRTLFFESEGGGGWRGVKKKHNDLGNNTVKDNVMMSPGVDEPVVASGNIRVRRMGVWDVV